MPYKSRIELFWTFERHEAAALIEIADFTIVLQVGRETHLGLREYFSMREIPKLKKDGVFRPATAALKSAAKKLFGSESGGACARRPMNSKRCLSHL